MKKNYNPFKMWGSYVGVVLAIILPQAILNLLGFLNIISITDYWNFMYRNVGFLMLAPTFGFLLGWAIHSLVRYFKK
jgi:hypothetical protein